MTRWSTVALLLAAAALASAQEIKDNLHPQWGDICKDKGDQWKNITLGPCPSNAECRTIKRGVFKCVPKDPALGQMKLGTVCYDDHKVEGNWQIWNKAKSTPAGKNALAESNKWREYYKERGCVWQGVDAQGTPNVQCIADAKDPDLYKCGVKNPLGTQGCFTVAGSMIWGRWNDNQMYDTCNGCPCTPPGKKCKAGPCKYPTCNCDAPCTPLRQKERCATA